jgi:hypothetical protein
MKAAFAFVHHLLGLTHAAELLDSLSPVVFPVFTFLLVAGGCAVCTVTGMVWGDVTTINYRKKFWMEK